MTIMGKQNESVSAADLLAFVEQTERRQRLVGGLALLLAGILVKGPFGRWATGRVGAMLGVADGPDSWPQTLEAVRAGYDAEWP